MVFSAALQSCCKRLRINDLSCLELAPEVTPTLVSKEIVAVVFSTTRVWPQVSVLDSPAATVETGNYGCQTAEKGEISYLSAYGKTDGIWIDQRACSSGLKLIGHTIVLTHRISSLSNFDKSRH